MLMAAGFAFGLDKGAAKFGHAAGEIFEQFRLRGDGVAEIGVQTNAHRGFGDSFVAFH